MTEYNLSLKLSPEQLMLLRAFINKQPRKFLEQTGKILAEEAQDAFRNQQFDNVRWLPQYPSQASNFVNIAGAVEDLSHGPDIQNKRFNRQPVGIDTGRLFHSLSPNRAVSVKGNSVVISTNVDYAEKFAEGGSSTQVITTDIRNNLDTWIIRNNRHPAVGRLRRLLIVDELETQSPARPYLDLTQQASDKIFNWFQKEMKDLSR